MDVYAGSNWQKGYGFGNVFGALTKVAIPLVRTATRVVRGAVGKKLARQGLKQGLGLATDLLRGKNMKDAAKARLKTAAINTLSGIDTRQVLNRINTRPVVNKPRKRLGTEVKGPKRKKRNYQRDIFS